MLLKLGRIVHQQRFTFAEGTTTLKVNLHAPHLQKYFNNDISQIDKQAAKQIAKKYSLNKRGLQKLFKLKPEVFINQSAQRAALDQKVKFLNKLQKTQPLAVIVNILLFDSKNLLLSMTKQDIVQFINYLKQFGFNEKTASDLFAISPNLIHKRFDMVYKQKLAIFKDYLLMSDQQVLELFVHEPFLITSSTERLRQSVVALVQRQKSVKVLTRQAIIKLIKDLGQFFLIGREQITILVKQFRSWGIPKQEIWATFLQNPLLLLNHPTQVFHLKKKMFKQFKFTVNMCQAIFRKYPSILICSVSALQNKFLVARDRLRIEINEDNIQFLTFKFGSNIRPRTEMLLRGKIQYTPENIVEYFKCSEEQFLQKAGIPKQKYQEQKYKYSITPELDFPNKKCLKNYPSQKKIFEYSQKYYPKQDLIIQKKK